VKTSTCSVAASSWLLAALTAASPAQYSPPDKTIEQWIALLRQPPMDAKHPDREWSMAPMALASIGEPAALAVTAVLRDDSPSSRRRAAVSLMAMGAKARVAVPELTARLKDDDATVRQTAAAALGLIGLVSAEVVDGLVETLVGDAQAAVRESAATSLGRLKDKRAIAGLREATRDANGAVRQSAARALRTIERGTNPGTPEAHSQGSSPPEESPKP